MSFVPKLESLGDRLAPTSTGLSVDAVISGDGGTIVRESEPSAQVPGALLIAKQRSLNDGNVFAVWLTVGEFEAEDPYSFTKDFRSSGL